MACMLPGAPDLDTLWRNVQGGVDAITEVPPARWDPACPAWLLYGEGFDLRAEGERLASLLPAARLEIVPGVAHSVLWHATDRVRAAVVSALEP